MSFDTFKSSTAKRRTLSGFDLWAVAQYTEQCKNDLVSIL
jgi:hypothetical protein